MSWEPAPILFPSQQLEMREKESTVEKAEEEGLFRLCLLQLPSNLLVRFPGQKPCAKGSPVIGSLPHGNPAVAFPLPPWFYEWFTTREEMGSFWVSEGYFPTPRLTLKAVGAPCSENLNPGFLRPAYILQESTLTKVTLSKLQLHPCPCFLSHSPPTMGNAMRTGHLTDELLAS